MEIDLTNYETEKIENTSSKGNQFKWKIDDLWYKADFIGYEGLAEVVVSDILKKSNIKSFCQYDPVKITYRENFYNGCVSNNFLKKNETLTTLEKIGRQFTGNSIGDFLGGSNMSDTKIETTMNFLERINVLDAGKYLTALIELDALTLNDDRHTNNIGFIVIGNQIKPAPIFDNGGSLFSDESMYPYGKSIEYLLSKIEAKPFSTNFDVQKRIFESLYGKAFKTSYNKNDLKKSLDRCADYYRDQQLKRVEDIMNIQLEKYKDLIVKPKEYER